MLASSAQFHLPENLQHYRVDACILNTSLLSVYQAWDSKLLRAVSMHILRQQPLHPEIPSSPVILGSNDQDTLYLQRARQAAALQHTAFIRIHALEEFDHQLILITEAVKGESFASWIQQHAGQRAIALKQVIHLASAIQEAHAAGLVVGDLRSANLLMDNAGVVRVPSLSLVLHQTTNAHRSDLTDGSHDDLRHDVFALGLLLFEMMTGQMPDLSRTSLQDAAFPWPEKLPQDLRELIVAMTDLQQEQGLSCQQVAERCRHLLSQDSSSSSAAQLDLRHLQQEFLHQELQRSQRQRLGYWGMIAVLMVLIVGVGGWQLKPHFPQLIKYLTPYSESNEMAQAARNLTEYTYKTDAKLLDAAEAHLKKVLERNPEHAAAAAYMSILYLSKYNAEKRDEIWFQKAKASAQQAMALNAELAMSLIANARILQWHHRLEEALAMIVRARRLDPENLLSWHTNVSILLEMRRFSEAIPLAMQGANQFPLDRYLLDLQAGMYVSQKKYAEAERVLQKSLQRQPDSPLAYSLLAECLTAQERNADALQVIQQGLQVRPNANLYGALANAKFRVGEYADAADAFAQAVSSDKGIAGSYLRWFEYAEALMWVAGREPDAKRAYQRSLELLDIRFNRSPDDETLLSIKCMIMARLNDFSQARVLARRTMALQSEDPYVHFWLAYTFELLHEREQALAEVKLSKHFGIPMRMLDTHPGLRDLRADPRYAQL
nr:tetratricopeptide repeat protein [uncultured Undibacterium sp.]